MIDIVIPFINSISGDQELVYALRSAEKFHAENLGDLYLVGDKPKCSLRYTHVPFKQLALYDIFKDRYMFEKILLASERCSESFFIWHDDNFILAPILGYYNQGSTWRGAPDTNYGQLEKNTRDIWPNTLNYDVHSPHLVTREGLSKLSQLDWSKACGYGIKTAYANLNQVDGLETVDVKFAAGFDEKQIKDRIEGKLFFSISDTALKPPMIKVLNQLYPNKSRWEM